MGEHAAAALDGPQSRVGGGPSLPRFLGRGDSRGSFTAAYYGLFGDLIFEDYEERFLRRNVQGALWRRMFNPVNWFRLPSPRFNRSDLDDEAVDRLRNVGGRLLRRSKEFQQVVDRLGGTTRETSD